MNELLRRIARPIWRVFAGKPAVGIEYWEQRAKEHGRRSVMNIAHSESEYDEVTIKQEQEIFPFLRRFLNGGEKITLDFGCGSGRFSSALAEITGGEVIGVDPIGRLLQMSPNHERTTFMVMKEGQIPLPENSVDFVWICLVLGGLPQSTIAQTIREIQRVLKVGGLLFLIENTSDRSSSDHWTLRSVAEYKNMFQSYDLVHVHDYLDLNDRNSVMAGRKR